MLNFGSTLTCNVASYIYILTVTEKTKVDDPCNINIEVATLLRLVDRW